MEKINLFAVLMLCLFTVNANAQKKTAKSSNKKTDSVSVAKKPAPRSMKDAYFDDVNSSKKKIYVNEEVTTMIIMPENIKMVDISTKKVVGNQCASNVVRIKPVEKLFNRELAGSITVIGERGMAQYDIVYVQNPLDAYNSYKVPLFEMQQYNNPNVIMTEEEMARYAYKIYNSNRKYYNIKEEKYGMVARINNIYTLDDYFFLDFSLENKTNIKYDIYEIRIKLKDKRQVKATNSQTIELIPVWTLSKDNSFKKSYRNVIVIDKLTFPEEKILSIEVCEDQISGRVIEIPIDYKDVLNADNFDESLIR